MAELLEFSRAASASACSIWSAGSGVRSVAAPVYLCASRTRISGRLAASLVDRAGVAARLMTGHRVRLP
jgi:hypothetical protein